MEAQKNLGIWMDHSTADFINIHSNKKNHSIISQFTSDTKEGALHKSENLMHNKRQQMNEAFYKGIAEEILKYDHVVLFGPTDAKSELNNYLNKDLHYKKIKIDVRSADKMTNNEKDAFVKNHFNK